MRLSSRRMTSLPILLLLLLAAPVFAANPPPPPPPEEEEAVEPQPPAEEAIWYVSPKGQALGPYGVGELVEMAARGEIDGGTAVWKEGMADWARLRDVPELAPVAAAVPDKKTKPPPKPPSEQELLDKEHSAYMVGTWFFEGPVEVGGAVYLMTVELTYRADGTFAGRQAVRVPLDGGGYAPPYVGARVGTYRIDGIDQSNFVMTATDRGKEPSRVAFEVIDQNTLRNVDLDTVVHRIR